MQLQCTWNLHAHKLFFETFQAENSTRNASASTKSRTEAMMHRHLCGSRERNGEQR